MSLNIKFSYLAKNSKFSRSNSYFSILTPTFLRDGFLNSCFQNPSENSDFGRCLKNFKMAAVVNGTILAILNLCVYCDAFYQVLAQSDIQFGRRCHLKNFKMATMAAILDIGKEWF